MSMVGLARLGALLLVPTIAFAADRGEPASSPNPLASMDELEFRTFVDAPLFDPARRAPIAAPVSEPPVRNQAPEPPPNLRLLGIIHSERDVAIVQQNGASKSSLLSTGDHIGSWEVSIPSTTVVRLSDGARSYDYAMFVKSGVPTVAASKPASQLSGRVTTLGPNSQDD